MDHTKVAKEQLVHLFYGIVFFLIIGVAAVSLDLLATYVETLGVSKFTASALGFTAHTMLVLDLFLFLVYLLVASRDLIVGMVRK